MPPDLTWFDILSGLALVAGAVLYLKSNTAKQNTKETQQLASTRGERIVDLEKHIGELDARIAKLEGAMGALQALKSQEIALEVARLLNERHYDPPTGTPTEGA